MAVEGENVTLAWSPPQSSGGSAIVGYRVDVRKSGSGDFTVMVLHTHDPEPTARLLALEPTTWYEFRVVALRIRQTRARDLLASLGL